jgi:hypothetical protein
MGNSENDGYSVQLWATISTVNAIFSVMAGCRLGDRYITLALRGQHLIYPLSPLRTTPPCSSENVQLDRCGAVSRGERQAILGQHNRQFHPLFDGVSSRETMSMGTQLIQQDVVRRDHARMPLRYVRQVGLARLCDREEAHSGFDGKSALGIYRRPADERRSTCYSSVSVSPACMSSPSLCNTRADRRQHLTLSNFQLCSPLGPIQDFPRSLQ